jgi:creatinine amidohydrolase
MNPGDAIFAGTMAEMTWREVEEAAQQNAVALWAFGVIEQHGPHLPAGTDVYLPSARLRRVKELLAEHNVPSVIVPPYYWGVNFVSASFPVSFQVRPQIMIELMADIFASIVRDGFKQTFCISGHGDALHNRTIVDAVRRGTRETGTDISFLAEESLFKRLGVDLGAPCITAFASPAPTATFPDIHAGQWETSAMLSICPSLVRQDKLPAVRAVEFSPADLQDWRSAPEIARRKTPEGHVGNPALASAATGAADLEQSAMAMTRAILKRRG